MLPGDIVYFFGMKHLVKAGLVSFFAVLVLAFSVEAKQNPAPDASKPKAAAVQDSSEGDLILIDDAVRLRMGLAGIKMGAKKQRKDYSISDVFVLNTLDPETRKLTPRANDDKVNVVFSSQYSLPKPARVSLEIFQNDSLVKKLVEEEQFAGDHPVYWNGLNEFGVKLFGDFECVVRYKVKDGAEKTQKIRFKVIK